eukprot:g1787.t1
MSMLPGSKNVGEVLRQMEVPPDHGAGQRSNVTVAVRARPLLRRERQKGCGLVVKMAGGNQVSISKPGAGDKTNEYAFDFAYWSASHDDAAAPFASQQDLFDDIGVSLLRNAWHGYNVTIFAYGQTGSGKSYSITGDPEDAAEAGLVPRVCFALFAMVERVHARPAGAGAATSVKVEASYLEIYNEHIRDLLNPKSADAAGLKVRELKGTGVFVQGLHRSTVRTYADISSLVEEGNHHRTVAATNMNAVSSRSHSILTIQLFVAEAGEGGGAGDKKRERKSAINLCDLAGSERASRTGATGAQLKEGAQINSSLSKLGRCISILAAIGAGKKQGRGRGRVASPVVPYRESKLTFLLKSSLSGNARTLMLAAISPSDDSYDETLSTLRYASHAKSIKTHAVKNETPTDKLIHDLKAEIAKLKQEAAQQQQRAGAGVGAGAAVEAAVSADASQLAAYDEQLRELEMPWEEKVRRSEEMARQRRRWMWRRAAKAARAASANDFQGLAAASAGSSQHPQVQPPQPGRAENAGALLARAERAEGRRKEAEELVSRLRQDLLRAEEEAGRGHAREEQDAARMAACMQQKDALMDEVQAQLAEEEERVDAAETAARAAEECAQAAAREQEQLRTQASAAETAARAAEECAQAAAREQEQLRTQLAREQGRASAAETAARAAEECAQAAAREQEQLRTQLAGEQGRASAAEAAARAAEERAQAGAQQAQQAGASATEAAPAASATGVYEYSSAYGGLFRVDSIVSTVAGVGAALLAVKLAGGSVKMELRTRSKHVHCKVENISHPNSASKRSGLPMCAPHIDSEDECWRTRTCEHKAMHLHTECHDPDTDGERALGARLDAEYKLCLQGVQSPGARARGETCRNKFETLVVTHDRKYMQTKLAGGAFHCYHTGAGTCSC